MVPHGSKSPVERQEPEELGYRLHQQSILSEFGQSALEAPTLDALLSEAVRLCAEGMRARCCKVTEYLVEQGLLLVRAGVGWKPGVVGHATLETGLDTPAGLAFQTGRPVLSNNLVAERRFRVPKLLVEHGIKRLLNVPVPLSKGHAWGVLAADSPDDGAFDDVDGEFMEGMARLLGVAIQGRLTQQKLEQHAALLRLSHDAIIVWTAAQGVELWSEGATHLYGFTAREALGRSPATLLEPVYPAAQWADVERELKSRGGWEGEVRQSCKDGHEVIVLSRLQLVRGPGERVLEVNRDISPRKRVEAALRASEERFRTLYEAQQTAHLILSPDLIIENASPAYLEATMKRPEELIGKHLFEAFPDNTDDPGATGVRNLRASLNRVLENRAPDRMPVQKYDIRRPSGVFEARWWAPLNVPVFSDEGRVRHIIHQVEDVTAEMIERQKAAEAKAGEARLRELADTIPGLVFETDPEACNTYVNEQYRAYTGLPFDALLGERWREVVHPDDRSRVAAAWREAAYSSQPLELEARIRRADGAWRWFMFRVSSIRDEEGRGKKGIGVCTDIDDAKRAQELLRESEQQFRNLAESLPQLTWMADGRGWIYWYNRRWFEYTGTTLEEMQGWGWRAVHHPDYVDGVVERIQRAWDTGEPWEDSFPLRGADGHYRWFLSRALPMKDSEGRVIRWFGTNTDITEKQRLEDLQKTLIHEISHRVKNSLALVSSLLNLQARTLEGTPRKVLAEAASRVHSVAGVHDQLSLQENARQVDLGPFIRNLAGAIATSAPRHTTAVEAESASVSADLAVPIGLLLNELLTNAYKYAYPEDVGGEVRVKGTLTGEDRYRLEVADFGRGLPAGFDLTKARGSLGTRVITSLATQLDGELAADSTQPGARFILTFPLRRDGEKSPAR